jgi:multiple sugar transport system substrate-binding protein
MARFTQNKSGKWSRRDVLKMGTAGLAGLAIGSRSSNVLAAFQGQETFKYPNWQWGEAIVGDWHRDRVKEFEQENPNFKVEMTQIASSDFETTILTQIAGGTVPDILPAFTNMIPRLVAEDMLEPLDAYLEKAAYKADILPSIKVSVRDGKTYGIPQTMSPQSLLYNPDLLEKAGVTKVPTTVEELFDACKQVKEKTGEWGYAVPTKTSDVQWAYIVTMQWIIGFGSNWSNADGTITANAPQNKEALEWVQKFLDGGVSPLGLDVLTCRNLFADGKAAFMIDGPWVLTLVKSKNADLYKRIGYAVSPTPTHAAITGGAFWTVPKDAQHKEATYKLLDIINKPDAQRAWLENTVQIPGTVVKPSEAFLKENPWVSTMIEVAAKYPAGLGYAAPGYEVYAAEFRKLAADHVAMIWAKQKSVSEALDEAQKALEEWAKTKK